MEPLAMEKVKRPNEKGKRPNGDERFTRFRRDRFSFFLFPFSLFLAGCVGTDSFLQWGEEKPSVEPCRVVAAWNPAVVSTADPMHGGAENPGLAGRIYLFGPEIGAPLLANGSLHVALFDDSRCGSGQNSPPLEEWHFDAQTFKRLKHHDPVGWGYTVFLPWGTYRPEIKRVHLKVCYEPPHGFPIYAASAPMTLVDPDKMDKWETSVAHIVPEGASARKDGSGLTPPSAKGISNVAARGSP